MSLNDKIYNIIEKNKQVSSEDIKTILSKHGTDRTIRTIQRHLAQLRKKNKVQYTYNLNTKELKYSIKPQIERKGNTQTFRRIRRHLSIK